MPRLTRMLLLGAIVFGAATPAFGQAPQWLLDQSFNPYRGRIGIQVQPMTEELRKYFKAPTDRGVLVSTVEKDHPADRAGVRTGDVIVSAGGDPVREPLDLVREVARVEEGTSLRLEIVRDGASQEISVRPDGQATPWIDPDYWREWIERGVQQGSQQLQEQLKDIERRLKELERRMEKKGATKEKQRT